MSHAILPSIIDNINSPRQATIAPLTIVDQIAEELTERILIGVVAQGTRLRQDAIAYEFSVSQAPVREAFRKLEMRRLVENIPRKGVRVTLVNADGEREIAAMRAVLEPLALLSIKGRLTPPQLADIRSALQAGDTAQDIYGSEAANRAFHTALAKPSAMPHLIASIADLNLSYSRHVFASQRAANWRARSNLDHGRIYEAVAMGQYEQAAQYLSAHIRAVDRVSFRVRQNAG